MQDTKFPALGQRFAGPRTSNLSHGGPTNKHGEPFHFCFHAPGQDTVTVTVAEIPEHDQWLYRNLEGEPMPHFEGARHIWNNPVWGPLAWCETAPGDGQWLPVSMLV